MSSRNWKRTRRRLRPTYNELDRRKRSAMRVPWWVTALSWLVDPPMRARWISQWQAKHEEKMRRAWKRTVRFARRIGG